ncbi:HNH endonuclease, partial [Gordonia sihwensis]|uniref:HNH endonuclease signature motif containing protein n=1 Tax=Gordonia sihwensis TaxID=173559 RepID=UPI001C92BF28
VGKGTIGAEHALVISAVLAKVPGCISPEVKARAEAELAHAAAGLNPDDLGKVGDRLLAHLDPDGQESDHVDRQRQRGITILPQDRQLMSKVRGAMTPELRAKFEVILTAWAAPGMNNPADPDSPTGTIDADGIDAEALAAARGRDLRSAAQRTHDALLALCDYVLAHGGLGAPNRIPAELVITVTDQELAAHAGIALTATGTRIPIGELVRLAAEAVPHLAVFRNHTSEVLYQGRAARFASKAQRLALFARDRGCTAPGCDRPFAQTQAHHAPDWITPAGRTDIDALGAACGRHNRAVGTNRGQWETTILTDGPDAGRTAWRPATTDQPWRLNPIHHAGQARHLHPRELPQPPPQTQPAQPRAGSRPHHAA